MRKITIKLATLLLPLFAFQGVSAANDSGMYRVKTNLAANDNMIISFASTDGKVSVSVNNGDFVDYEVSTDFNKKTPLMFTPGTDSPEFVVKGDLTAFDAPNESIYEFVMEGNNSLVLLNLAQNDLTNLSLADGKNIRFCYLLDNSLSTLDLSKATKIEELNINFNEFTDIDLSQLTNLKAFSCDHNSIANLDVSNNTMLEALYCKKNKITDLDITALNALRELSCESNKIDNLNLSNCPNIEMLYCKDNMITNLYLDNCSNITELNCSINELTSLDLTECTNLLELYCFSNQLTELNVSQNMYLGAISCGDNALTEINLEGLSSLMSLSASYNHITDINLTGCSMLMAMAVDHNELTTMNLSDCEYLFMADVSFNQITDEGAAYMAETIAERTEDEPGIIVFTNSYDYPDEIENNVCAASTLEMFYNKYWVLANGDEEFVPTGIESLSADRNEINAIYDVNGIRHNNLSDGINIVVLKNGKTVKIVK